jgi:hypothetical protein
MPSTPPPFEVTQPEPNFWALGAALSFLAGKPPFSGYHLAQLVRQVETQLQNRSVLIARGQGRLVGYFGWERMPRDAVQAMAHDREMIPRDEILPPGPDIIWITVVGADHPLIARALARSTREMNPGLAMSGLRTLRGKPSRFIRPTLM